MISSEVQRTLVKSPPELWAELSDPDSLARHLGELGEVRITRVEPEKLVEWEAAGITGKVAIKASGWGTRVTLTVERELDELTVEAVEKDAEDLEPIAEDAALAAVSTENESVPVPEEAEASTARDSEHEPDAVAVQEPEQEPEPPTAQEPTETAEAAEGPKPAPATEAARRAAGWPAPETTDHAGESDLETAEAIAPELPGMLSASAPAPPTEPAAEPSVLADAPAPRRRGFFARLFGSRRKSPATPTPAETAEPSTVTEAADEEPRATPEPAMTEAPATTEAPRSGETPETTLDVETVAEHEDLVSAQAPVEEETPLNVELTVEPAAAAVEQPVELAEAQARTEAEPTGEPEPASAKDIAAELKAAEESATAEVTAILTGVLDRLGAAHHRPFSRA